MLNNGVIMFVHGMGHSFDRYYWREWAEPLKKALSDRNLILSDEQFDGVYYYDLVPGPGDGPARAEGIQAQLLDLKQRSIEELGNLRSPFVKGLKAVKKLSNYIVDNFGDIFTYLYHEKTHRAVNQRLYEAINEKGWPVHLIGYSLGSIVSYCALKQNEEVAKKVSHLIMLGSPLYWFKRGVEDRVGLEEGPPVGRITNIAGILDIAWPQAVPKVLSSIDESKEFVINLIDPIQGHLKYFYKEEGLAAISSEIIKGWQ